MTTKLKELVGNVPQYYVKEGDESSAYWQYTWLSPLRDNDDFSSLYEEAKIKAKIKDDRPYKPERTTIRGGRVYHTSPISKEEVLKKPIDELVKYLNDFKGGILGKLDLMVSLIEKGLPEFCEVRSRMILESLPMQ